MPLRRSVTGAETSLKAASNAIEMFVSLATRRKTRRDDAVAGVVTVEGSTVPGSSGPAGAKVVERAINASSPVFPSVDWPSAERSASLAARSSRSASGLVGFSSVASCSSTTASSCRPMLTRRRPWMRCAAAARRRARFPALVGFAVVWPVADRAGITRDRQVVVLQVFGGLAFA